MSVTSTINQITSAEIQHVPAVVAAIQAAETVDTTGKNKFSAVLDTISGVSGAIAQVDTNPQVAGIAALINLTFAVLDLLGKFKHKTASAVIQPAK